MKNTRAWYLLVLLSLGSAAWSQTQQSGGTNEKAVAALENQWLQSQKTNNPDLIAPLLADKFVSTGVDGKLVNKARMLAEAKEVKWSSAEYDDVQISVFGDTAIATGVFKGKGTDASGKPITEQTRWTDTWVKMPNGKWQCVASQDTLVKT